MKEGGDSDINSMAKQDVQHQVYGNTQSLQLHPRHAPYVYAHAASRMREPTHQHRPYNLAFPLGTLTQEFACPRGPHVQEYGLLQGPRYEELALTCGLHGQKPGFLQCQYDATVVLPNGSRAVKAGILDEPAATEPTTLLGFLEPYWNVRNHVTSLFRWKYQ